MVFRSATTYRWRKFFPAAWRSEFERRGKREGFPVFEEFLNVSNGIRQFALMPGLGADETAALWASAGDAMKEIGHDPKVSCAHGSPEHARTLRRTRH